VPWFRRKKREEGAPAEAAPEARAVLEETPPSQQDPASSEAEDKPARKRRRGSRGGRGRKKPVDGDGGQVADVEEKPIAKPRRARESEKPGTRARKKPEDARRRRRTPTKRIDIPDVEQGHTMSQGQFSKYVPRTLQLMSVPSSRDWARQSCSRTLRASSG